MFYLCSVYVLLCAISYIKFPPSYFSCIEKDVKLCNDSWYSFFCIITKPKQGNNNFMEPNGKAIHIHQIVGCVLFAIIKTVPVFDSLFLKCLRRVFGNYHFDIMFC